MICIPEEGMWDFKKGDRVRVRVGSNVPRGTEGVILRETILEGIWAVSWDNGWGVRHCHPLQMELVSRPSDCEAELRALADKLGFGIYKKKA